MDRANTKRKWQNARFVLLPALLAALLGFFLSSNVAHRSVQAFSSGPPAGFTGAPDEFTCAECHVPTEAGTGQISISAPQTYVPGEIYPITITHTNADPTRRRWGFQLTVLDSSDGKAGNLQSTNASTKVLDNQGPGGARQYIEHTSAGTFAGQQGGASWTFNWTAPAADVGPVTFYAAGNHANYDGNSSGDHIYFTFVTATATTTPPVLISDSTSTRAVALESVHLMAEPFSLLSNTNFSSDNRTRISIFAMNADLFTGEGTNVFSVEAEDAAHVTYPLNVEHVGQVPGFQSLTMIVVRLNDSMGDLGDVLLRLTVHGMSSNRVRVGIGHIGGGPPDDLRAVSKPE